MWDPGAVWALVMEYAKVRFRHPLPPPSLSLPHPQPHPTPPYAHVRGSNFEAPSNVVRALVMELAKVSRQVAPPSPCFFLPSSRRVSCMARMVFLVLLLPRPSCTACHPVVPELHVTHFQPHCLNGPSLPGLALEPIS